MRIVTRADLDGVVCAVLIAEAENINEPVKWIEPNEMQHGKADVVNGDIVANLPYHDNCSLWFDHHYTNKIDKPFNGVLKDAPSAAGLVYRYYKGRIQNDYDELVCETDKIDSANLSVDEVLHSERFPYFLLSMTISSRDKADEPYWNRLVELLRKEKIDKVIDDPEVNRRIQKVIKANSEYKDHLLKNTTLQYHVSVTDFRSFVTAPEGNRFLVFSLFPETTANVKMRVDKYDKGMVVVNVGNSLFNDNGHVNIGAMVAKYGGGGHRGAGSCAVSADMVDKSVKEITDILVKNKLNGN